MKQTLKQDPMANRIVIQLCFTENWFYGNDIQIFGLRIAVENSWQKWRQEKDTNGHENAFKNF
jgi:hypothetical protein